MGVYNNDGNWIVLLKGYPEKEIAIRKDKIDYIEYELDETESQPCGVKVHFTSGEEKYIGLGNHREDVEEFMQKWLND